ncbi:LysM peptidoglycan-binding domain-containing protein [Rhodoferax aquaticus]|uniref:LysM domain-containing protein n=1 Tax=Rhodoferax aquaticus TaxID=2527691 RepID=A0A515EK66_9BURK|nr:LysM domain-containing protein [Rhodoferax aquaticus]QDL53057.1 LysM domain-containing protein [Rhodoferax aquaticus]
MKTHLMAKPSVSMATVALVASAWFAVPASAQNFPITQAQKQTATQVAQAGVPLSELAANAPDRYTVKSGDTLWGISTLFLKSPWRWPELWGMNLEDIKNPHRIYPGQVLVLERSNGAATLRVAAGQNSSQGAPTDTIVVSPRTRFEALANSPLPALKSSTIEPFLAEPLVVDESTLKTAARIVSAQESRVLLARGDRAYARGPADAPMLDDRVQFKQYRVFRNATPMKDPESGEVLGYEAQYIGKATLVRGESTSEVKDADGKPAQAIVPATIDIVAAKEEMRVGDRMLPEPARQLSTYVPRAPDTVQNGRIVSVYGSAVVNAAQNQVVAINRGSRDGLEPGHVLAILKDGARVVDKSDPALPLMKLPDERNGLLMVFRTFERVSYALIIEISNGVRVGDRLVNPR